MSVKSTAKAKVKNFKELPGILECMFEHEVSKTTCEFKWTGPKISPEAWNQVLAFLRWTYVESKSESQVRLYVNAKEKKWGAFAHKQRAGTGMTSQTHNITETPEESVARATLMGDPDPGNWTYFGTVHHHCSAGAFQSGVDEADERNQAGLHITVGKLDKPHFDLHDRFYLSGCLVPTFSLADVWDSMPLLSQIPESVRFLLPADGVEQRAARHQMGVPPPADVPFPEEWKLNFIYEKPEPVTSVAMPAWLPNSSAGMGGTGGMGGYWNKTYVERSTPVQAFDLKRLGAAIEEMCNDSIFKINPITIEQAVELIRDLQDGMCDEMLNIMALLCRHDVLPENALAYFESMAEAGLEREMKAESERVESEGGKPAAPWENDDPGHWSAM